MTKQEFAMVLVEFDKQYRVKTIPTSAKLAYEQLANLPIEAMKKAVDSLLLANSNPNRPPSMERLIRTTQEKAQEIQRKITAEREDAAQREKDEFRQGQAKIFNAGMGQDLMALFRKKVIGRISQDRYVEEIRALQTKYPNRDFSIWLEKEKAKLKEKEVRA